MAIPGDPAVPSAASFDAVSFNSASFNSASFNFGDLPIEHYAFPGPLRDALVAAILDGTKTSTTSIAREYELDNEPLPEVGDRGVVVDSAPRTISLLIASQNDVVSAGADGILGTADDVFVSGNKAAADGVKLGKDAHIEPTD